MLSSTTSSISDWVASTRALNGEPVNDVRSLAGFALAGNHLLNRLGLKRDRSAQETRDATTIHTACRDLRRRFLSLHAAWLYDSLTEGGTLPLSLEELVSAAAERCPGLVPTEAQLGIERSYPQAEKEGFEIDQGLLIHAWLSIPRCGEYILEMALRPRARSLALFREWETSGRLNLGTVLIERQGCAASLIICNQDCLNAEDERLVDDLETGVDLALLDPSIRVGVLRGGVMQHPKYAGQRVFSSGINLKRLHQGQIPFLGFLIRRELGFLRKIGYGLLNAQEPGKPWIGAVDSFAIGGGAQILLMLDHVIGAANCYFSLPAAKEGIVPGFANLRLSRFLGPRKARQVILRGQKISADSPDAALLFDEIVDSSDIDHAILRGIQDLSAPAVVANRHMLNLAEESVEDFLKYAAEFALCQSQRLYSDDVLTKVTQVATKSGSIDPCIRTGP